MKLSISFTYTRLTPVNAADATVNSQLLTDNRANRSTATEHV